MDTVRERDARGVEDFQQDVGQARRAFSLSSKGSVPKPARFTARSTTRVDVLPNIARRTGAGLTCSRVGFSHKF